jgi:hypothetical protein
MKLAVRRTYLGDRLCFPDVVPDRLLDVQATYARQPIGNTVVRGKRLKRS